MIDSEVQRLIEQMSAQAEQMVTRMKDVRGEGSDDRNLVKAVCGPGGRLQDIEFAPEARRLQTYELREQILIAVQRAAEAADEALRDVTATASGLGDGLGGQELVAQTQREMAKYKQVVDEQLEKVAELQARLQR